MNDQSDQPIQHQLTPMTFEQRRALMMSLNGQRVSSRDGTRGAKLSYLETFDVKANLIRIFGFGGFSAEVVQSKIERILTNAEHGGKATWVVLATATVRLTIHQLGAVYTESAASSQAGSQIGEVADFALKTAESDALKRCAIYLGTQFGLSLYDKGSTNDVVREVLAQGQEWPPTPRQVKEYQDRYRQTAQEQVRLNAENAQQQAVAAPAPQPTAQQQRPVQGGPNPIQQQGLPSNPNLTPEQSAANQALLEKALSARADLDAAQEQGQAAALEG